MMKFILSMFDAVVLQLFLWQKLEFFMRMEKTMKIGLAWVKCLRYSYELHERLYVTNYNVCKLLIILTLNQNDICSRRFMVCMALVNVFNWR